MSGAAAHPQNRRPARATGPVSERPNVPSRGGEWLAVLFADTSCMDLTYFNRARAALAKAVKLDEAKEIRDKAEALRIYTR